MNAFMFTIQEKIAGNDKQKGAASEASLSSSKPGTGRNPTSSLASKAAQMRSQPRACENVRRRAFQCSPQRMPFGGQRYTVAAQAALLNQVPPG
jgi:hypothetical protein